jgi:sugar lactone lactonase YvrE
MMNLDLYDQFPHQQVTGVAVSREGRVFVNFPFWSNQHNFSVVALDGKGGQTPFPDAAWNDKSGPVDSRFVCVQSVFVDDKDALWILDSASPMQQGVVKGGAKLVKVDLKTKKVDKILFDDSIAPPKSYLNDVRIDTENRFAFITESGEGSLVVVNLQSGKSRRVLSTHFSVKPQPGLQLKIENVLVDAQVAADCIALDANGGWLYYKALTGRTRYRIPVADLENDNLNDAQLAARVEPMRQKVPASDGLEFRDGVVWITAIEDNGIARYDVAKDTLDYVFKDDQRLKWPDSLVWGPASELYVTTSQIHLMPQFNAGQNRVTEPFCVWKVS